MRRRKPRTYAERAPITPERLDEARIEGMNRIFPGFAAFYRANYDDGGRFVGQIPGLRPVTQGEAK